jgi:hypothetical protein
MSETKKTVIDGSEIIATYLGMDMGYRQGKVMEFLGKKDAAGGAYENVGTLTLPIQAQGVNLAPTVPDPVMWSYLWNGQLRELLVKIQSQAGQPSTCTFSVLVPSADGAWVTRTADITLVNASGTTVAFNPHGVAQSGNILYLIDFEAQWVVIIDTDLLEAAADNAKVPVQTFDLSVRLEPDARGQAIIVVNSKLYALFVRTDIDATAFDYSQLVRMSIGTGGALAFDTMTVTGLNSQSIIPVLDGTTLNLLIPAIGGVQDYNGHTNGTASSISYVVAEDPSWPGTAPVKVTGDPGVAPATAYDIHGVAAAMRDGTSALYILTQIYDNSSRSALWRIYRTTVGDFLGISDGRTLSQATTAGDLTVVDGGTANATDPYVPFGIYFWDILYEQVPGDDDDGDRLWVAMGTPILVTRAGDDYLGNPGYGSPTALFQNAYAMFGYLGGTNVNMNGMDLTVEATNQAKRGNVSLKRTLRTSQTPKPTEEDIAAAAAARAAKK